MGAGHLDVGIRPGAKGQNLASTNFGSVPTPDTVFGTLITNKKLKNAALIGQGNGTAIVGSALGIVELSRITTIEDQVKGSDLLDAAKHEAAARKAVGDATNIMMGVNAKQGVVSLLLTIVSNYGNRAAMGAGLDNRETPIDLRFNLSLSTKASHQGNIAERIGSTSLSVTKVVLVPRPANPLAARIGQTSKPQRRVIPVSCPNSASARGDLLGLSSDATTPT